MANKNLKNFKKKKIQEFEDSGFGKYDEAKGGGTPRGGVYGGQSGRVGWDERTKNESLPQGAHREEQPRTADGQFTYNSVNGKKRKYDYHGKGDTVNPLLTGGKNNVKAEDVKAEFAAQSGTYWDKYKDSWYVKGSEKVSVSAGSHKKLDFHTKVAAETIWETARKSYDEVKGEFEKESEVFSESKKGRSSKTEQAAKQQAKATGEEQYVMDPKSAAIKNVSANPNAQGLAPTPAPVQPQSPVYPQPGTTGVQPGATATASDVASTVGQLQHSADEIQAFRDEIDAAGEDSSQYTDQEIDYIMTQSLANIEQNSVEDDGDSDEEEDETTKKLKNLGFSE